MSSAKSPTGRFGLLFGLKRRPSSNFQQQPSPQTTSGNVSPSYQQRFFGTAQELDPFAAHTPPTPSTALASSPVHTDAAQKDGGLSWNFEASDASEPRLIRRDAASPERIDPSNVPARRPSLGPSIWPSQAAMRPDGSSYSDHFQRIHRVGPASAGPEVTPVGQERLHDTSATSVESLALAAAIAHANGMVLQPNPSAPTSVLGIKSPPVDEYPSPPPSTHASPYNSGIPSSAHPILIRERGSEDDDTASADGILLHLDTLVGSAGTSSLPTTPALIDSFPATPHAPHPLTTRGHPATALLSDALPIRTSSRREPKHTVPSSEAWSSSSTAPPAQFYSPDLDQAWNMAEQSEEDHDYNYPFSLHTTVPGPPPSAPLPPEPLPARMQSSVLKKRIHELEVDFAFLERKISPTSPLSTASLAISLSSSKSNSPRMIKKTSSQRGLSREASGPSGSSAASSTLALSPSSTVPPSTSPLSSESPTTPSKRQRSLQLSLPVNKLRHSSSFGQRSTSEATLPLPTKTKEKDKKPVKEKSVKEKDTMKLKDEKDREAAPKRRFFSKYSSIGSTIDRDAVAAFPRGGEGDDARSLRSMQSSGTGFPDEEWGAIAISSSLKTQESCMGLIPISPTSQRSPADDMWPARSIPQTPARTTVNPPEYTQQYILPPAEILRLERVGFVTPEHNTRRGRDGSTNSPQSTSVPPSNASGEWRRRSTSTSRLDTDAVQPSGRAQRSGSLAGIPSGQISSGISPSMTRDHHFGSRSFVALPSSSDLGLLRTSSTTSSVVSSQKPRMTRSFTSPSSPVTSIDSLPPPPRTRIRSLRGANEPGNSSSRPSTATSDGHSIILSPPPRTARRPSTASSVRSVTTQAQKHYSILRKPSFLDIADDDGRPSLEEASADAAPGFVDDQASYRSRDPSPQMNIHVAASGWASSSSLPIPSTSRQPTPVQHPARIEDDSFLDMGKMSLETIRSEPSDDDEISHQELLMQRQREARLASLAHAALTPQYQPNPINRVGAAY